MKRPYLIIQCTNYFEYIALEHYLKLSLYQVQYFASTYTFKLPNFHFHSIPLFIEQYAPNSKTTKVHFKNNRAIYTIIKD